MTQQPGQLIAGRYLLGRCLARGGMGSVWEAEHVELQTRVAVKLLRAELGENAVHVERFRREARTAAKLRSPHVVAIHDCGVDHGVPFIAMEFLEGEDLELRLRRLGRLEREEALAWLDQAARGLAVAHAAGLVHRDVKPANLFIERMPTGERLKVVDFGIARPLSSEVTLTTGTGVWGSPAYMSPEQARGRAVDQRTDVWALAGVFYRTLTGRLPFRGLTEHDMIVEVCTGRSIAPSELELGLPPALDAFFARAFAKDPDERTPSVEELAQEGAEAIGQSLAPFEALESRTSAPSWPGAVRNPGPSPLVGRLTETRPIAGDTGPTGIATASRSTDASSARRWSLRALALVVLALGLALLAPRRNRPPAPPDPTGAAQVAATPGPSTPASPPAAVASPPRSAEPSPPPAQPEPKVEPKQRSKAASPPAVHPRGANESPRPVQTDPLFGLPVEREATP